MERFLIEHCSPTLAGLKTANLFSCPINSDSELNTYLWKANNELNNKDVYLDVLRRDNDRAIIYVYRKKKLQKELLDKNISDFLALYGYSCSSVSYSIEYLKKRFESGDSFPHEIGVFLGYPLEDVIGFIDNAGKNSKCSGCWKVYSDECNAVKLFELYNKCKKIYMKLFAGGRSIMQLTVAA
jgi:hypothetical protein